MDSCSAIAIMAASIYANDKFANSRGDSMRLAIMEAEELYNKTMRFLDKTESYEQR